ncbi:uncharacterized protein LOC123015444 [Tribolium madens]|uniref:uncharacterized protein LOC123015444 n=1 Tax=Tribolium madens TaxID=41895 RepID=UPI001CF73FA9|nr:uncharacterized protein LOC123015444 [Tribolium madens]
MDSDFISSYDSAEENILPPLPKIPLQAVETPRSIGSDDTLSMKSADLMPPPPPPPSVPGSSSVEIVQIEFAENLPLQELQIENSCPHTIVEENQQVRDNYVENVLDAILKQVIENKKLLETISNQMQSIKSGSAGEMEKVSKFDTLPKFGIKKYSELLKYDQLVLNCANAQKQLETMFQLVGGATERENIRRGEDETVVAQSATCRCVENPDL